MKHEKNIFRYIVAAGLLAVVVTAAIGFYASRPQASVTARSEAQAPYLGKSSNTPTPQPADEVLSQTLNEITIKVTSAKIIKTGVEIGICYTTLDGGEWYSIPGHLFYSSYEIYPDEAEFTTETLADGKNFGERCELIRYRVDDIENITTPIQFSIIGMRAPQREMYSSCEELQQRLDTSPKAQSYGLKAKCEEKADGSVSVALLENSKTATTEESQKALDIIVSAEISGNWEFTIIDIKSQNTEMK